MNIALVGPGIMEIPPKGWGAVESLIWDYATELGELGHEGTIINTPDRIQIIRELSEEKYDFIHVPTDRDNNLYYDQNLWCLYICQQTQLRRYLDIDTVSFEVRFFQDTKSNLVSMVSL